MYFETSKQKMCRAFKKKTNATLLFQISVTIAIAVKKNAGFLKQKCLVNDIFCLDRVPGMYIPSNKPAVQTVSKRKKTHTVLHIKNRKCIP